MGGIRGSVIDVDYDAPLPEVKVMISETGQEMTSAEGGSFFFEGVAPGSYTLMFSKSGYTRQTKSEVVVTPGQLAELEISMQAEYEDMDELVVKDIQMGGTSEAGLLNLRSASSTLMDAVGADMMSQAGAGDAASALKLVAGATVQDGKYAVVRGLPDRYVNSQMNSVRLPSADPEKRAVQLDQFPAAMIESMQVSKTFTPDQQGDASGGAVNVVLKGIPDESILKFTFGTKYKSTVNGQSFLTYDGGSRDPQTPDTVWAGDYGVKEGDAPAMYDWSLTLGGNQSLFGDWKVGALANVYYKHDASSFDDGINDKYWLEPNTQSGLVPKGLEDDGSGTLIRDPQTGSSLTSLYDVQKSTDKVQWGWLGVAGMENEWNKLTVLNMRTHVAEDKATLAEDTRGHDLYNSDLPYRRNQTLEYIERDTDTLQFHGTHTIPVDDLGIDGFITLLDPELDWTYAKSSSALDSPDKRIFGSLWSEGYTEIIPAGQTTYFDPVSGSFVTAYTPARTNVVNAVYREDKPNTSTLGNIQRIWKEITEDSDQYFVNGKLPFELWNGEEGFIKVGIFQDKTIRKFDQDTYSNTRSSGDISWEGEWNESWSSVFYDQAQAHSAADQYQIHETDYDVDYTGKQEIFAYYYMLEIPLSTFLKLTGGARYESTSLSVEFNAEDDVVWYDETTDQLTSFKANPPPNNPIDANDVLPSLSFELTPIKSVVLRGCYSETVARPTFKEFSPVQNQEYVGGDIFIGNSALSMSALKNYDLRADWTPYTGGLVSFSWFSKDIADPIEYTQKSADNVGIYTTAENYPDGQMDGLEFEVRQQLGKFCSPLEGWSVGGNMTLIHSEVAMPDDEVARYYQSNGALRYGFVETSRDMLNAPEFLYNLYTTYDLAGLGTKIGLFYTVKGDTLLAGPSTYGEYVPSVYATEYGTLNLSLSQKLSDNWTLSFKLKNLNNPKIQQVYRINATGEEALKASYTKGIEVSLGLSGKW